MHTAATKLPEGWQAAFDARYQRWYYVNVSSGTSQWDPPQDVQQQEQTAAVPTAATSKEVLHDNVDPGEPAAGCSSQRQQQHEHQQQQGQPTGQVYCYHDPYGRLMGPFTVQQLTAWRPFLPMDLLLLPQQHAAANTDISDSNPDATVTAAGAAVASSHGAAAALSADGAVSAGGASSSAQQTPPPPGPAAAAPIAAAAPSAAAAAEHAPKRTQEQAAEASRDAPGPFDADQGPGVSTTAAAAADGTAGDEQPVPVPASSTSMAAAVDGSSRPAADAAAAMSGSTTGTLLADLLGDTHLLEHYTQSCKQHGYEQQQHNQQQQQQQQQAGQVDAPKPSAPPAPVWQAWVQRHNSSSSSSVIEAPTAVAAGSSNHWQQQQQQQQIRPHAAGAGAGAGACVNSSVKASSFDKYAAAVLQGLPPEDEAVQLARMAAMQGYSLSQVLQQHRQQGPSMVVAGPGVDDVIAAGGITVTSEGVRALMVKDPRSGRLSVAAGGSNAGVNGSSSAAAAEAVGLYGDLARWCDPAALERTLHRKRQQQQQPGRVGASSSGGAAPSKRTRLATG